MERDFSVPVLEMSEAAEVLEGLNAARYSQDVKPTVWRPDYQVPRNDHVPRIRPLFLSNSQSACSREKANLPSVHLKKFLSSS